MGQTPISSPRMCGAAIFYQVFKGKSIRLQTHEEQSFTAAVVSKQSLFLYFYYLL